MSAGTSQRFAWLSPKERARRNAKWLEWPVEIRKRFRHEVALRLRGIGERRAVEIGWEIASRVDAWRRRAGDAKACGKCRALVLWRREQGDSVPIGSDGFRHACGRG